MYNNSRNPAAPRGGRRPVAPAGFETDRLLLALPFAAAAGLVGGLATWVAAWLIADWSAEGFWIGFWLFTLAPMVALIFMPDDDQQELARQSREDELYASLQALRHSRRAEGGMAPRTALPRIGREPAPRARPIGQGGDD